MRLKIAFPIVAMCMALSFVARADGPGAYRPPPSLPPPAQQAQEAYDAGVKLIDKADREAQAGQSKRANKGYERALSQFNRALRVNSQMHEALTYVGYANRKLGRYEPALEAYGKALRLQPDFAPAIEYQGEAFLGLNRIEDAKHNYFRLYATAPDQADKLFAAMDQWVQSRKQNPEGGVAAEVEGFASWVAERVALKTEAARSDRAAAGW